jgi:hypothetical protein
VCFCTFVPVGCTDFQDIALQCKILTDDGDAERCLEGPVFRKMSDRAISKILPKLEVMARCSPEDKLRLVKLLRAKGEVVAGTRLELRFGFGFCVICVLEWGRFGFGFGLFWTFFF